MTGDNPYSRFVAWSKIVLPLAALALLSTLFLFARQPPGNSDIPFSEIEEIARQPRVSGASFAGVAEDGSVIAIRAAVIRPMPEAPGSFAMDRLRAEVSGADGTRVEMTAGAGEIDGSAQRARLTGLVQVTASSGYRMETAGIEADLRSGEIRSLGPLEVRGPPGSFTAGQLVIRTAPGGGGQRLLFTGGVRLLYTPQQ